MDRKIIIGYDVENGGLDPIRLGRKLTGCIGAQPIVIAALPWPEYLMTRDGLQAQLDREMKPHFELIRDQFGEMPVETRAVAARSGSRALQEAADDVQAPLIVIGSSHRGPIGRTLAGSTGESLMHGAPCAIAIAPRSYGEPDDADLKRVAVAFDGSPESWSALETAIGLADHVGGNLTVLTIADYLSYGYSATWSVFTAGELDDAERREKRRILETGLGRIPEGLPSSGRLLTGDAGAQLAEASSDHDVLITGSRGYGPLRRAILGSTTRQLVAGSACPVLVIPRAVGADPLGLGSRRSTTAPGRSTQLTG